MRNCFAAVLVLLGILVYRPVCADGLIFQLPPDGYWARYDVVTEGEFGFGAMPKQKIKAAGTLTVESVGEVSRNAQKCRWIELKADSKTEGVYPKLVLKLLIPEDYLKRGEDPLSHSLITFFSPKPVDEKRSPLVESYIDEGFNRIQYEIDRFRDVFPKPLDSIKRLKRETVQTMAGSFERCEVISGTSRYDGPLLTAGRSVYKASYRIVLHPNAPFGVVALQIDLEGSEMAAEGVTTLKVTKTLILAAVGKDAVSDLKNGSERKPR